MNKHVYHQNKLLKATMRFEIKTKQPIKLSTTSDRTLIFHRFLTKKLIKGYLKNLNVCVIKLSIAYCRLLFFTEFLLHTL